MTFDATRIPSCLLDSQADETSLPAEDASHDNHAARKRALQAKAEIAIGELINVISAPFDAEELAENKHGGPG